MYNKPCSDSVLGYLFRVERCAKTMGQQHSQRSSLQHEVLPGDRVAVIAHSVADAGCAVMRKMITTLNAMVGDNAPWQPRAA
jgi:hypothetical protein